MRLRRESKMKDYTNITEKTKWTYTIHGGVYIAAAIFSVLEAVLNMDTVFLLLQAVCFAAAAVISGKTLKTERCLDDEMSEHNLRRAKAITFDFAKVIILIIFSVLFFMRAADYYETAVTDLAPYILACLLFFYGVGNLATGILFKRFEEE